MTNHIRCKKTLNDVALRDERGMVTEAAVGSVLKKITSNTGYVARHDRAADRNVLVGQSCPVLRKPQRTCLSREQGTRGHTAYQLLQHTTDIAVVVYVVARPAGGVHEEEHHISPSGGG
jgi:predicted ArsR family transcriptional regulator